MILNILIGLLGLGIVVFVHEAGHFLSAKAFGIRVKTFSLGWGKKLYSFKKGETEYCISMLPLGGYCQLEGEDALKDAMENNLEQIKAEKGSLFGVHPWKRIVVFFSGPFMNLIFSIITLSFIWYNGFSFYSAENRIILASEITADGELFPADKAGLKTGDRIIEIDSRIITNYQDVREEIALNPEKELSLKIERNNSIIPLTLVPEINRNTGGGMIGIYPWIDPVVEIVTPGSPADISGMEAGDIITSVSGTPVKNQMDVYSLIRQAGVKYEITYKRDNIERSAVIVSENSSDSSDLSNPGFIFSINRFSTPDFSAAGAFKKGFTESFNTLFASMKGLRMLFKGVDLNKAVSGPIRITYMVGEVATKAYSEGIENALISFFQFLSLISIALFFMNLLPIPALDGGQIVFSLCEIICRKNFKPKIIYRYQVVGFTIIFALIFFSLFNDLLFLIKR